MTDPNPRLVRLEQICAALHGKVLDHDADVAEIEVPNAPAAAGMLGMSGFSAVIIGQDTRMAPRRITNMQGYTVVDPDVQDLTTYFRYRVQLAGHAVRVETSHQSPTVANITRPTPKFGG